MTRIRWKILLFGAAILLVVLLDSFMSSVMVVESEWGD